jgi:RNA polymerase sigma-70 factor (ECF subfamily)
MVPSEPSVYNTITIAISFDRRATLSADLAEGELSMSESVEEKALVELYKKGDENAARIIVERYIDRLVTLARRRLSQRLSSRVDPEDIVQSAFRSFFVRAREGRFVFAEQDDLCKLLVRITLHKTLRQVAFHKAAKRDPGQETEQGEHHQERLLALLDGEPTPEAEVAFLDQLEHFFRQLRSEERQILEMRMQGYTNEEIGQKLGLYDRKIRRVIEHVRAIAEKEGLAPPGQLGEE